MKTGYLAGSAMVLAGAIALTVSSNTPARAGLFGGQEVQQWDMCSWETIPDHVLRKISRRGDFDEILQRMFDYCPDSALGLTDRPTASVSDGGNERDQINGGDDSSGGPFSSPSSGSPLGGGSQPNNNPTPDTGTPDTPGGSQGGNDGSTPPDFGLPG